MDVTALAPLHGGPDALGVPLHDFSTNSNACGPCPGAVQALREADARHYPDPAYTALREHLGAFHSVAPARIVIAGSASEFIHRITAFAARQGVRAVAVPVHGYGDYTRAAQAWGLDVRPAVPGADPAVTGLCWACEPASPLGTPDPALAAWAQIGAQDGALRVLDCAYAPLRLEGTASHMPAHAWQLWTPNKALGLTGVRAAYAIAPQAQPPQDLAALQSLAPSWPIGAHGVALLTAWTLASTQRWLGDSLDTLRAWKAQQQALCESLGWAVLPGSLANYFVARPGVQDLPAALAALREEGIKLRDCASFGLPGQVRLGVLAPRACEDLAGAWARHHPFHQ